jgi:two-component system response regulator NreC
LLLGADPAIQVVGEAASADDALRLVTETTPDVILLDLSMPGSEFTQTIRSLQQALPSAKILVLTMHDDVEYAKAALGAGATSYLTKGAAESELLATVKAVYEGRTSVSLGSRAGLPELLVTRNRSTSNSVARPHIAVLSEREQEVMRQVAMGFTSAEIAEKLFLSVKTVDTYRSRLMAKLSLKSRAELVQYVSARVPGEESASQPLN